MSRKASSELMDETKRVDNWVEKGCIDEWGRRKSKGGRAFDVVGNA